MASETSFAFVKYQPGQADAGMTEGLIECYRDVFGETPWDEWKKCRVCGRKWGRNEAPKEEEFLHCGQPLVEFWPAEVVRADLQHEITSAASCWLVLEEGRVVGFCWGYPISSEALERKLEVSGLSASLRESFGDTAVVAYQDELGIVSRLRGRHLARQLFDRRLQDFRTMGLRVGVIRTKTRPPSVTYLWFRNLGYRLVAEYHDNDGRVVLARELVGL